LNLQFNVLHILTLEHCLSGIIYYGWLLSANFLRLWLFMLGLYLSSLPNCLILPVLALLHSCWEIIFLN